MDTKKYLKEQIKKCKNKMNFAKLIDYGILFAAAGGVCGIFCELVSLVLPFYHANLAAGLCFGAGALAGAGCAIYRRADMSQAARRLDSFGLKERMITAYELMDGDGEAEELAELQRQDAFLHYNQIRDRIKISLVPDKRHVLALLLSTVTVIGLCFVPSSVRDQARLRHQVQEEAEESREQLEELVDALEGVDLESLTEEQKAQMQELMEAMRRSREELAQADTWESLGCAMERLDYKYEQAGQSLERLASQMENPEGAGVASAQALARAANQNGTPAISNQAAVAPGQTGSPPNEDGNGSGDGSQGSGNGNGSDGQNAGNNPGSGEENGSGSQGSGEGTGSGEENGFDGQGLGTSSGDGDTMSSGTGGGRGTGSSSATHDYVSIPNAIADDSSLTGNKSGDQDSDYFRQQNGLAWEGEHVDYNSVIGQYTDSAYEGLANGRYPSGMEPIIRDYFENLNK